MAKKENPKPTRSGGTPVDRSRAGGAHDDAPSRHRTVLQLQHQFGNAAVAGLIGSDRRAPSPSEPVTVAREGGVAAPPRPAVDVVEEARAALEGVYGQALTPEDASRGLVALSMVPVAVLPDALRRLGPMLVDRMLQHVPRGDRTTAAFGRISVLAWTLGAATPVDAWAGLRLVPLADRTRLLFDQLTPADLGTLVATAGLPDHTDVLRPAIASLPRGTGLSAPQQARLKIVFDRTGDALVDTLLAAIGQRFGIDFHETRGRADFAGVQWEAGGLRRSWPVLEALPPAHIAGNRSLDLLTRYQATSTEGVYFGGANEAAMGYDETKLGDLESGAFTKPGDPLYGRNVFDATVRHEVGHAVDQQLGWSEGSEPKKEKRGGWKVFATNYDACADAMIQASDGAIQRRLSAGKKKDIRADLADAMGNQAPLLADLQAAISSHPWFATLKPATQQAILADSALVALSKGLGEVPWSGRNAPYQLGRYVFHESYDGDWVRTEYSAWTRRVSSYQFRAPGEWFAEAYAAYYEPAANVGDVLALKDGDTKTYFDKNVHNMGSSR